VGRFEEVGDDAEMIIMETVCHGGQLNDWLRGCGQTERIRNATGRCKLSFFGTVFDPHQTFGFSRKALDGKTIFKFCCSEG
jgi:hypothetical protein